MHRHPAEAAGDRLDDNLLALQRHDNGHVLAADTRCSPAVRLCSTILALAGIVACVMGGVDAEASQSLQGSVAVTSDYMVRGVSHSDDQAEVQFDLHAVNLAGFFGGMSASTAQYKVHQAREVELDPYLGYGWQVSDDWHAKILADAYLYPRHLEGRGYHSAEVAFAVTYRDWLSMQMSYSPNAPRVSRYEGLVTVAATSAEVSLVRPILSTLMATAGIGYSHLNGRPEGLAALNYAYWSIGADYELAPVSLTVSYVGLSEAAKTLYYNGSGGNRWVGAVIWRF